LITGGIRQGYPFRTKRRRLRGRAWSAEKKRGSTARQIEPRTGGLLLATNVSERDLSSNMQLSASGKEVREGVKALMRKKGLWQEEYVLTARGGNRPSTVKERESIDTRSVGRGPTESQKTKNHQKKKKKKKFYGSTSDFKFLGA